MTGVRVRELRYAQCFSARARHYGALGYERRRGVADQGLIAGQLAPESTGAHRGSEVFGGEEAHELQLHLGGHEEDGREGRLHRVARYTSARCGRVSGA